MKSKTMLLLLVSFIIVVCFVILLVVFSPSYLSVSMSCVEIMEDEAMGQEGEIVIRGLRLKTIFGNDIILLDQLHIAGTDYNLFKHDPSTVNSSNPAVLWTSVVYLGDYNKPLVSRIAWTYDWSSCIVSVNDKIFVGSVSKDYADAFAQFDSVVYIVD